MLFGISTSRIFPNQYLMFKSIKCFILYARHHIYSIQCENQFSQMPLWTIWMNDQREAIERYSVWIWMDLMGYWCRSSGVYGNDILLVSDAMTPPSSNLSEYTGLIVLTFIFMWFDLKWLLWVSTRVFLFKKNASLNACHMTKEGTEDQRRKNGKIHWVRGHWKWMIIFQKFHLNCFIRETISLSPLSEHSLMGKEKLTRILKLIHSNYMNTLTEKLTLVPKQKCTSMHEW